jgi:hypothetical protein
MVSVGDLVSETRTRAFVFSTSGPVNIDFASEAVVRMILSQVAAGTDLCSFSPATIAATVHAVESPILLPGTLTCTLPDGSPDPEHKCVRDYNYQAARTATAAPTIQAILGIAAATPTPTAATQTPTRTTTSTTPVATETPTRTATPTTPAPTQSATTTPTGVTPTSSAAPSETPTATPPPPTPTLTPTATWTSTPTATAPVTVPQITLGSVPGAPGTSVNVPISLAKNGVPIVTIAPLVFGFDANVLSFVGCTTGVAGASISAVSPASGQVNVVLTHTVPEGAAAAVLPVLPEGTVAECTFTISASASAGSAPLTFIGAQTADAAGTEYSASGTNGAVTITAAGTPTATPAGPSISLGTGQGPAGGQAAVPITLAKNGVPIVTIAPLVFGFDANVLSFVGCTTGVAGASISAVSPASGQVNVVLTHTVPEGGAAAVLPVLPEGTIAQCTFTVSAGASAGSTPVTFIGAQTADGAGTEYGANGASGSVTVQ